MTGKHKKIIQRAFEVGRRHQKFKWGWLSKEDREFIYKTALGKIALRRK